MRHALIVIVTPSFVVEDEVVSSRSWDHEDFFRNAMLDRAFPSLAGTERQASEGDVIVVSDIDEIPRPETMVFTTAMRIP